MGSALVSKTEGFKAEKPVTFLDPTVDALYVI